MKALLDALARWGLSAVAGIVTAVTLLLVVGGFGLGVAHGTASAVAYTGAAGIVIVVLAVAVQTVQARDV